MFPSTYAGRIDEVPESFEASSGTFVMEHDHGSLSMTIVLSEEQIHVYGGADVAFSTICLADDIEVNRMHDVPSSLDAWSICTVDFRLLPPGHHRVQVTATLQNQEVSTVRLDYLIDSGGQFTPDSLTLSGTSILHLEVSREPGEFVEQQGLDVLSDCFAPLSDARTLSSVSEWRRELCGLVIFTCVDGTAGTLSLVALPPSSHVEIQGGNCEQQVSWAIGYPSVNPEDRVNSLRRRGTAASTDWIEKPSPDVAPPVHTSSRDREIMDTSRIAVDSRPSIKLPVVDIFAIASLVLFVLVVACVFTVRYCALRRKKTASSSEAKVIEPFPCPPSLPRGHRPTLSTTTTGTGEHEHKAVLVHVSPVLPSPPPEASPGNRRTRPSVRIPSWSDTIPTAYPSCSATRGSLGSAIISAGSPSACTPAILSRADEERYSRRPLRGGGSGQPNRSRLVLVGGYASDANRSGRTSRATLPPEYTP